MLPTTVTPIAGIRAILARARILCTGACVVRIPHPRTEGSHMLSGTVCARPLLVRLSGGALLIATATAIPATGAAQSPPVYSAMHWGAIGAIAVAPSDPNVIYVGTGAGIIRPDLATGDGIYKSTDAGKTWVHLGLHDSQMIAMIDV